MITPGNRLLDALPDTIRGRLSGSLELVSLATKQLLAVEDQPVKHAYFPLNCLVSLLSRTDGEQFVEVATVGSEGMTGIPLLLGVETTPLRAFCQVPGECYRMSAVAFRKEVERGGPFVLVLHRYMHQLMVQFAQGAACNSRHSVEQRCARWLLMTADRVKSDKFPMTHEFLCQMLGVRRATISELAAQFQESGYVEYSRGWMTVKDRGRLGKVACDCYRMLRDEYARPMLPSPGGPEA